MRGCAVVSHLQARPNQSHAARIALGIRAGDVVCDTRDGGVRHARKYAVVLSKISPASLIMKLLSSHLGVQRAGFIHDDCTFSILQRCSASNAVMHGAIIDVISHVPRLVVGGK